MQTLDSSVLPLRPLPASAAGAVAFAAVLVPDGAQTVATFRIIAIKKSPTLSVRLYSGNISTPGTLCFLSHSPGTLPRANQQSTGLLVPALRCRLTSCGARIGRRPLGRGLSSATAAPAPAPCFRRRRRPPSQLFSSSKRATKIKAPTAGHAVGAFILVHHRGLEPRTH